MIYNFMRLMLFFDLPVVTPAQRHKYSVFHRHLIKNGYLMMQFSVYTKIFQNVEAVEGHIKQLKKSVPDEGNIRLMTVTEKQYAKIEIILGGKSIKEEESTVDPLILL